MNSGLIKLKNDWEKFRPLLEALVIRDLKLKYRRSFLGYVWSLLNPLMMMAIMTVVFSYMFRFNIENYPLYLICGQTLWTFFNESTMTSMESIIVNGSLIRKVYIPKFIFPLARVASTFVTTSFSLAAILIVMLVMRVHISWTILLFWIPLICLMFFCVGVGLVISALSVYFRDVLHLYSVLTLAWMYVTPIFYPFEMLPHKAQLIVRLNPMFQYINFFRCVTIYNIVPDIYSWIAIIGWSALSVMLGMIIFSKLQRGFIFYL